MFCDFDSTRTLTVTETVGIEFGHIVCPLTYLVTQLRRKDCTPSFHFVYERLLPEMEAR